MDFAAIRAQTRQTVHDTFATPVTYNDGTTVYPTQAQTDAGLTLTARWGTRLGLNGDLGGEYTTVMEGVDRLRFRLDQAAALGITLTKNAIVTLTAYDRSFLLDVKQPNDGPVTQTWLVVDATG